MVRQRLETSKIVLAAVLVYCGTLGLVIVGGWLIGLDGAAALLGAAFVPAGTAIGFYAWKAKAENVLKYAQSIDQSTDQADTQKTALDAVSREQIPGGGQGGYYNGY